MARLTDPPPPRSPFLLPPPRPQLPPASPALQQRAWAALALSVLSLLAMTRIGDLQRGGYVAGVALAVALLALALSFPSMSAARRAGTRRPRGVIAATVLGLIAAVLSGFLLAVFLFFHTEVTQYSHCLSGASTPAAQTACRNQFDNSIRNQFGLPSSN